MCSEFVTINSEEQIDIENIQEVRNIISKLRNYKTLWRLFSVCNKILMIINFITILLSIFITEGNVTLALSIFTLLFQFVCDTRRYIPTLEKLLILYQDYILVEIHKYIRNAKKNIESYNIDNIIDGILEIEKSHIVRYMGESFTLSNTLRGMDCKKILSVGLVYVVSFISIGFLCYYKHFL